MKARGSRRISRRGQIVLGLAAAIVVLCAGAVWYVSENAYSVFGESGKAYGSSLARAQNSGNGRCAKDNPVGWYCGIEADPGSGYSGPYFRLTADGSGCWSARRYVFTGGTGRLIGPTRTGCVALRDYLFPKTVDHPPQ